MHSYTKKHKKTIANDIESHMEKRWKYICENNWQGKVTKKQYFNANRKYVKANMLEQLKVGE